MDKSIILFLAHLDTIWSAPSWQQHRQVLTPAEHDRGRRFVDPTKSSRWQASRFFLRSVLAATSKPECRPEAIELQIGPTGKPFIDGAEIEFNLSHSDAWAVVAVSPFGQVGVDIEFVRDVSSWQTLADSWLGADFRTYLEIQPAAEVSRCLLQHWCQREAIAKAHGGGVSVVWNSIRLTHGHSQRQLVDLAGQSIEVQSLDLGAKLVGAVACQPGRSVVIREFIV